MFQSLFNAENPFWTALSRLGNLILLNFCIILCCLPVLTAGAGFAAASRVLDSMAKGREPAILTREFFRAFKKNFRQATAAWLILILCGGVFAVDAYYGLTRSGAMAKFFAGFGLFGELALISAAVWLFPLIARYVNPLKTQFSNALRLALGRLPQTLLMDVIILIPLGISVLFFELLSYLAPVWMLIGLSGMGLMCASIERRTFERLS